MKTMVFVYLIILFLLNFYNLNHQPPFVTCSTIHHPHPTNIVVCSHILCRPEEHLPGSISSILCHPEEHFALLGFLNSMAPINYSDPFISHYTQSWKKGTNCCDWDGITCDDISHHVVGLDLLGSGLVGSLDSNNSLFQLRHLRNLDLSYNDFSLSPISPKFGSNFPLLEWLHLDHSNFSGEIPDEISSLSKLQELNLGGNGDLYSKFTLSNWSTSLEVIDLSNVNLSSKLPYFSNQSEPNKLTYLNLRGCSLYGQIPNWVWNISMSKYASLTFLDLSHNKLDGTINLKDIDISHNSYLVSLDLSYNMFDGPLPILPITTMLQWFSASNNHFTGYIHSSFCNLTSLQILDLSNNYLEGELPYCLGNVSNDLIVLNLGSNFISGTLLGATFSKCSCLKFLDLSINLLSGLMPRMLTRCKKLEVLNLRSNKFKDKFPHWFGTFSHVQVLDLSNNNFFGHLSPSNASNPFSKLQVLDLSNNYFSGKIPAGYIESFKAMMNITLGVGGPEYMESNDEYTYFYSITLSFNGVELKYEKIITTLVTFDLSNNKFEGEIPENIGQLASIHGLNLSHNLLTSPIPKSIGNLTLLNCLDLSSNKLSGKIPQELTSLTSLGFFNVSNNQLKGPIPTDTHFETFPVDSYMGNVELCGFPLPNCQEHGKQRLQPSENDDKEVDVRVMPEWEIVMMGCGFGTIVSFAWGWYMLSIGRPLWLLKLVLILVALTEKHLFGRRRR